MAVDLFLKLDGIEGESKDAKHGKQVDLLAWSWGMSQSSHAGMGGGVTAGKVNIQDFSVTKYIDKATPVLLLNCCNGTTIKTADFFARKAGGKGGPIEYLKISMKEVLITSVSTGGSGGEDKFTENVTMAFDEVEVVYLEQTDTGGAGNPARMKWNTAQNKGG
jgi:type VI secretion system secreted protein Hcp